MRKIAVLVAATCALTLLGTAIAHATNTTARHPVPGRYVRHVFPRVQVARDLVYGHAMNHAGVDETLRLDVYQPERDVDRQRAAVVWLHPGGFTTGTKAVGSNYATDFAQRGYVAFSVDYRARPKMQWFDMAQRPRAARDAYDDATMAITWIRHHATEYGISTTRIFVAGYSAGAVTALEVASPPDGSNTLVAGAMAIAGYDVNPARPGQAPRLLFHGTHDLLIPYALGESSCAQARAVGDPCQLVTFTNGLHDVGFIHSGPIAEQTARFFSTIVARTNPA